MGWGGDTGGGGCTSGGVEVRGGDGTGEGGSEVFALKVYGDGLPFKKNRISHKKKERWRVEGKGKEKEKPTF